MVYLGDNVTLVNMKVVGIFLPLVLGTGDSRELQVP